MPDGILLEDGNDLIHQGGMRILLEGEDTSLTIPTRTNLGSQIGTEVISGLGFKVGDQTLDGVSA